MSLFRRIALSLLLPLVILLGALSVQSVLQHRNSLEKNLRNDVIQAAIVRDRLEGLGRELKSAASLIAESRDCSRAVRSRDLDYLFEWTGLFHSDYINRIIITDEEGNVLVRSHDQFFFSDYLGFEIPVKTALEGGEFWGLVDIDGEQSFVFSQAVLLYGELTVGTVSVCASLSPRALEYLSDAHTVNIRIGEDWPPAPEKTGHSDIRAEREESTGFYPPLKGTDSILIRFYETEASQREIRNSVILIALLAVVILISLVLVYQVLSNYIRPYSDLVESFSLMARKEVDFEQLRQRLSRIKSVRNKEAGLIAEAFEELSFAIERDMANLEDSAHRDALTGLRNRRHCDKAFAWEFNRHRIEGASLSLIMADIDHFKEVNDNFGHIYGDEILVEVAKILQEICRATDIPVRWGGEEFMVLCPFTELEGCAVLAEKLRQRAEERILPLLAEKARAEGIDGFGKGMTVGTLSLGCAVVREHSEENPGYESADKALYRAKKEGRNRVVREG